MKKMFLFCLTALITSCTTIGPGHVGIKVSNMGSERGVQNYTVRSGLVFFMPGLSTIFEYPTFVQTAIWTSSKEEGSPLNEEITFNSKEGTVVSGDISLSFQLRADSIPKFYVKFRSDDLNSFTHGFLRNVARDAFTEISSQYTLEEVYGVKKEEMLKAVRVRINDQVNPFGVDLIQFGFIGALRMDEGIKAALNRKLQAIQDAIATENQLKQSEAEARKIIALAEGQAKANTLLSQSVTTNLIQWKQMDMTLEAIKKWDGHRPMVEGTNGNMFLQLPVPR